MFVILRDGLTMAVDDRIALIEAGNDAPVMMFLDEVESVVVGDLRIVAGIERTLGAFGADIAGTRGGVHHAFP